LQARVSDIVEKVTKTLEEIIVRKYLGYTHIPRNDFISRHTSRFSQTLLNSSPQSTTVILDGTYLYIQKSSNFELQKMTFSLHKFRNLVKPMMIISTTGYILDVEGLYFADNDNNDANIFKSMLEEEEGFNKFFQEGDNIVLDRGFRDCIAEIEERNYIVLMPSLLDKKKKQFTTSEGNQSRRVTMIRWLVEAVNGRIKNVFKFFDSTIPITYHTKLWSFFRIACAISNLFFPPLFMDNDEQDQIVGNCLERMSLNTNPLQEKIEEEQIEKKTHLLN